MTHRRRFLAAFSLLAPGVWLAPARAPAATLTEETLFALRRRVGALSPPAWVELSETNRRVLYAMQTATHGAKGDRGDALRRLDHYFSFFAPDAELYGYTQPGAVGPAEAKRNYEALVLASESMLVSDEFIVAGHMAAQRYHVLSRFNGEFFGRRFNDEFIALRGQDIFEMTRGAAPKIARRWANHDHAYRVSQMAAPGQNPHAATLAGAQLAQWLNGPLPESAVYGLLERYREAFNDLRVVRSAATLVQDRTDAIASRFVAACPAEGGAAATAAAHHAAWLALMPDVTLTIEGNVAVANFGAIRWRATGRYVPEGDPRLGVGSVALTHTGETIFRFAPDGLIERMWTHHHGGAAIQDGATR